MKAIIILYAVLVGVFVAATVGFGIAALYPEPTRPDYPEQRPEKNVVVPDECYATVEERESFRCQALLTAQREIDAAYQGELDAYQAEEKVYQEKASFYNRTTVFLGIAIGALTAILALLILQQSLPVTAGLLLGGVLTAILARSLVTLASQSSRIGTTQNSTVAIFEFAILLVLTIAVALLGLKRFPR